MSQAVPLFFAELVHLLYNVVDRVFIGHMPDVGSIALTGVGLIFPITTLVAAFTNLFSSGGTALFSIARGEKDDDRASLILNQVFMLTLFCSLILMAVCYLFRLPILYLFGASDESVAYADAYLVVYLIGTPFTMLTTGLNGFINAQGAPKVGMGTIIIGAVLNLVLDPVFIFAFDMGVAGAAWATVISQVVSCVWVMHFFLKGKSLYRIRRKDLTPCWKAIGKICTLGIAGFIMRGTNSLVSVVCNKMLKTYGGDLYVGVMTVLNSVREILSLPTSSLGSGGQPVLGFNFGAKKYSRVKQGIKFMTAANFIYLLVAWLSIILLPEAFMSIFSSDPELISAGTTALKVYFFGFFFMGFQFIGQSSFIAMGYAKKAITFSIFRKVIIVVPLTIILPGLGLGVMGVYIAEPISNVIGGIACFLTMILSVYSKFPDDGLAMPVGRAKR